MTWPKTSTLTLGSSGGEGFGEQLPEHVAAVAHLFSGECVDLGDGFGVEADRVHASGCLLGFRHAGSVARRHPDARQRHTNVIRSVA